MGWLERLFGDDDDEARDGERYEHPPPPVPGFVLPTELTLTSTTIATGGRVSVHPDGEPLPRAGVRDVTAQLVNATPDADSEPNAIAVYVGADHVGWLDPAMVATLQPLMAELNAAGARATVAARIVGSRGAARLELDMELPPRRRTSADPVLVGGVGDVSIVGEDECQELLRAKLGPATRHDFVARLTVDDDGHIAALYDGDRVGAMTSRMSPRYRPLVDHLLALEWPATCRARIVPGATKLEVVLSLPQGAHLHRLIQALPS